MATGVDRRTVSTFQVLLLQTSLAMASLLNQKPPTRFSAIDRTRPMVCKDADRSSKLKRMCQNSRRDFLLGVSHLGVTLKTAWDMSHRAARQGAFYPTHIHDVLAQWSTDPSPRPA
jgi:hypothetical protein